MHTGSGRIVRLRMNTMSLYESDDSSEKISLKELCDDKFAMQMLDEVPLKKLAIYIVRGGWSENISVDDKKVHLMPRAYIDN